MKHQLNARLVAIKSTIDEIQNQADGRDLSDSEARQIETLYAEFSGIENQLDSIPNARLTEPDQPGRRFAANDPRSPANGLPAQNKTFAGMFGRPSDSLGGFRSIDEFLNAVAFRPHHEKLQTLKNADMSEGDGAAGGFLVPQQLYAEMLDASLQSEIIRPRGTVYPIVGTNAASVVVPNTQDRSSTLAGFKSKWMSEAGTGTRQAMALRTIELKLNKLMIYARASTELTEDGLSFESQLRAAMTAALGFDLDEAFITGTGAGMPTGFLNADSTITQAKDTAISPNQQGSTILYSNILGMWSRMHPAFHRNAIWLCNPECIPQLYSMVIDPNASTKVPVFVPGGGDIAGAPSGTLLGRPLFMSEHCSALGTEGDIILVDPTQYAIGLRTEATMERSIHESWMTDQIDFRLRIRVTGLPMWKTAITPRNGVNTLSWCVTLADR